MKDLTELKPPFTQDDCEHHIAKVWAELLQYQGDISSSTNFFEVGGDSLATMMMLFKVGETYEVEIQSWAFIELPTLGALCRQIYLESPRSRQSVGDRPTITSSLEGQV